MGCHPRRLARWSALAWQGCPPLAVPRLAARRLAAPLPTALFLATLPLAALLLAAWSPPAAGQEAALSRRLSFDAATIHVLDGDTFDADLNGDGTIDTPAERVRLLYVDTPELHESHKGQDVTHGLPARDALARWLGEGSVHLTLDPAALRGAYGRTLAVVYAGRENLNLRLIRAGHSHFDTRFRLPAEQGEYQRYVAAEAEAFTARRGIWGEAPSRRAYLARLKREHHTPQAAGNPLYHAPLLHAGAERLAPLVGRYVRLRGVLRERRPLRKEMFLLRLGREPSAGGKEERGSENRISAEKSLVTAVIFPHLARRLTPAAWPMGRPLYIEGFVQRYRGRPQIVLHYATAATAPQPIPR